MADRPIDTRATRGVVVRLRLSMDKVNHKRPSRIIIVSHFRSLIRHRNLTSHGGILWRIVAGMV